MDTREAVDLMRALNVIKFADPCSQPECIEAIGKVAAGTKSNKGIFFFDFRDCGLVNGVDIRLGRLVAKL